MDITLVIVDNGDTEPEIWGFESLSQAHSFAEARGNGAWTQGLRVLDEHEGAQAVEQERSTP